MQKPKQAFKKLKLKLLSLVSLSITKMHTKYKNNRISFNLMTRPKWLSQGEDAKKMPTLSQNTQEYFNPRSKISRIF
jgi:hypothetical protein